MHVAIIYTLFIFKIIVRVVNLSSKRTILTPSTPPRELGLDWDNSLFEREEEEKNYGFGFVQPALWDK